MKTRSDITKKLLAQALEELLKEKSLNKISIQEIVNICNLNRQTFYYHFEDIHKLVEWSFKRLIMNPLSQYEGEALWQEGLRELLIGLEKNRTVCKHALCDMTQDQIYNLFYKDIALLVQKAVDEISHDKEINFKYIDNITTYFSISFGSIIEQWIFGRIHQSVDELVTFLDTLIKDQIHGAIHRLG